MQAMAGRANMVVGALCTTVAIVVPFNADQMLLNIWDRLLPFSNLSRSHAGLRCMAQVWPNSQSSLIGLGPGCLVECLGP